MALDLGTPHQQLSISSPTTYKKDLKRNPANKRWLAPSLQGRFSYVEYNKKNQIGEKFEKLRDKTPYPNTLNDWLESRKLEVSAEKSSATVLTSWSKEPKFDPHLTINNSSKVQSQSTGCYLR